MYAISSKLNMYHDFYNCIIIITSSEVNNISIVPETHSEYQRANCEVKLAQFPLNLVADQDPTVQMIKCWKHWGSFRPHSLLWWEWPWNVGELSSFAHVEWCEASAWPFKNTSPTLDTHQPHCSEKPSPTMKMSSTYFTSCFWLLRLLSIFLNFGLHIFLSFFRHARTSIEGKCGRNEVEWIAPRSPRSLNGDCFFWHRFDQIFQHFFKDWKSRGWKSQSWNYWALKVSKSQEKV